MMIFSLSSLTNLDPVFPVSARMEVGGGSGAHGRHRQSHFRALGCQRTLGFSEKGCF